MAVGKPDQELLKLLEIPRTKKELAKLTGRSVDALHHHIAYLTTKPSPTASYVKVLINPGGPYPTIYQTRKAWEETEKLKIAAELVGPDGEVSAEQLLDIQRRIDEAKKINLDINNKKISIFQFTFDPSYWMKLQLGWKKTLGAIYVYCFSEESGDLDISGDEKQLVTEGRLRENLNTMEETLEAFLTTIREIKQSDIFRKSDLGKAQLGRIADQHYKKAALPAYQDWLDEERARREQ